MATDASQQDNNLTKIQGRFSPVALLLITIGGIAVAEIIAMIFVYFQRDLPYYQQVLIDAVIMTVIIFPILYFLSFRPILQHIDERRRAEKLLQEMALFPTLNPDAVLQVDVSGQIMKTNPAGTKMGLIPGRKLSEFIPDLGSLDLTDCIYEGKTQQIQQTQLGDRVLQWVIHGSPELGLAFLYSADITEQKRAETEIYRLSSIVEQTADTVVVTNREGIIEYVNPAFERQTGYSKADVLGQTPRVLKSGVHDEQFYQSLWGSILVGEVFSAEITNRKRNGELLHEVKTITPLRDAKGNITHFVATGKDITERKEAEEKLRKAHSELELRVQQRTEELVAANAELTEEIKEREGIEAQLTAAMSRLEAHIDNSPLAVIEFNPEFHVIRWSAEAEHMFGWKAEEVIGHSIAELNWVYEEDVESVLRVSEDMLSGKNPRNVNVNRNRRKDRRVIHCEWYNSAIYNAEGQLASIQAQVLDITERKQVEEQIARSNQKLNEILESIQDDFYVLDRDWNFVYASRLFTTKIGKEPQDFVGHNIWEMFPKHLGTILEENFREAMEKRETRRFELSGKYTPAWYRMTVFPSAEGITVIGTDITERKRTEEALRESEEKFRSSFANAAIGFVMTTPDGHFLDANPAYCSITGYDIDELRTMGFPNIIHPDDYAGNMRSISQMLDGQIADFVVENRYRRKNGGNVWVRKSVSLVRSATGLPQWIIALVEDITNRKRMEDELRLSEMELKNAQEVARIGNWKWDIEKGEITWSDEMYRIFGIDKDSYTGRLGDLIAKVVHPDDLHIVLPSNAPSLADNKPFEYRIILPDKSIRHIWARSGEAIVDSKGKPIFLTGIAQDITERKQMEEALRLSEERFRLALKNAPVTVAMQDTDLRFVWAYNQRTVDPNLVVGKTDSDLFPPEDASRLVALKRQVLETGVEIKEQLWVNSGGRRLYLGLYLDPMRDESGKITGVGIATVDFTERKQAEEELYKLNRTLKALSNSNQALMHAVDEVEFLNQVCKIVVDDCGHVMVWIGYAEDDENKSVRPVASAGFEAGYLETLNITWADTERGRGPTGTAIRTGKPSRCRNMLTDPQFEPWRAEALKRGYASSIVLPLLYEGKAMGALTIYSKESDPFSEDEERLLSELAGDLAQGIASIRLRQALARTAEELSKARDELELRVQERTEELAVANRELLNEIAERKEIERQLRIQTAAMESAANGIVITDPSGNIMWTNPALTRMSGYSERELIGQNTRIFNSGQHAPDFYREMWSTIRAGNVWKGEMTNRRKDGSQYIEGQTITPVRNEDGEISHFIAIKEDITERKRIEAEIQERNQREKKLTQMIHTMQVDIARDLHDTIGQNIGYLRMKLDYMAEKDISTKGSNLKAEFSQMSQVANESYDLVRGTLAILQSQGSDDLLQLFKRYASQIVERSALDIEFTNQGEAGSISTHQMRQLFYIFREALSNIEKYSGASYARVDMSWRANTVELSISDNGKGFDASLATVSTGHYGLKFMRERTELMKGSFQVKTELGGGTQIIVNVPIERDGFENQGSSIFVEENR